MASIVTIETASLGDRSYLVHDGSVAFVVDPQRDIDRVQAAAADAGVSIVAILETHIHNDYLTGGYALARETGAAYYVNGADEVSFERTPVADGDVVSVGSMRVRAIATPGHTFTHLSFALEGETPAVFTGGSLLFGSTGRPDLLGEEHTETLARHQHASAHRLADEVPDEAQVMPTHGFGSFCSATQASGDASTIGREKRDNPALTQDEASYVEEILAGLGEFPAYYAHMGPANAAGPLAADLSAPTRADVAQLRRRLEAGEWLVDLRTRTMFAAGHAPGTFNFGLEGEFATYVGWLIPWGRPLTLLGESWEQVAQAQRELVRIGIDRPAAATTGGPRDWTDDEPASFPQATFPDLAQVRHHRDVVVLDVRRPAEFAARHIEGAVNLPLHNILTRSDDVPAGEVWVHCASGYRAAIAASILATAGRRVVVIDDSFDDAGQAGLALTDQGRPAAL
ncbi:MAG TPA: MBL fold metallo-hydrolase [Dermatophilaceae bacterium]|nr:MBL fold metallo-hydrolase [Dermatophilaceae bacterium]